MTNETTCIIKPTIPPIIQIHGTDGRVLLTIHPNGTVEGDIEDASEAARVFVEHIRRLTTLPTQSDDYTRGFIAGLDDGAKMDAEEYAFRASQPTQSDADIIANERKAIAAWMRGGLTDFHTDAEYSLITNLADAIERGTYLQEQGK